VSGTEMNSLDVTLAKALNGDGGGSWTPAASIIIGGAGMWFGGPVVLSNAAGVLTSTNKHIVLGTNDYIYLGAGHSGATRTIDTQLESLPTQGTTAADGTYFSPLGRIGNVGGTVFTANPVQPNGTRFLSPINVHHGATLTGATLTFRVNDAHAAGVPDSLIAFRVLAVDVNGNVLTLSSTAVAGTDGSVAFTPRPANGAAWNAAGAAQTVACTCDQNNVIDVTQYSYWVEVFDEMGTNAYQAALLGNTFLSLACTFTNITDMRPQ
jgi:hypothetical protein